MQITVHPRRAGSCCSEFNLPRDGFTEHHDPVGPAGVLACLSKTKQGLCSWYLLGLARALPPLLPYNHALSSTTVTDKTCPVCCMHRHDPGRIAQSPGPTSTDEELCVYGYGAACFSSKYHLMSIGFACVFNPSSLRAWQTCLPKNGKRRGI